MSRPKKPDEFKVIEGTFRKDRANDEGIKFAELLDHPAPPDWILKNDFAVREWERLVPILMSVRLLSVGMLTPLAHLCAMHGQIAKGYDSGYSPSASEAMTLKSMYAEFGLTPVAVSKVKSGGAGEKGKNKFSENKPASSG